MSEMKHVYILGTRHPTQRGSDDPLDFHADPFEALIRRICDHHGIKRVVEEMLPDETDTQG